MNEKRTRLKKIQSESYPTRVPHVSDETTAFLSRAVSGSYAGIAQISPNGKIEYANASFAEFHGYQQSDIIGRPMEILHPPGQKPVWANAFGCADGQKLFSGTLQHLVKDGGVFESRAWVEAVRNDSGALMGYLVTVRQVVDSRDRENCDTGGSRYRLLYEQNLAGIYRTTFDGLMLECNDTLVKILGYDSKQDLMAHSVFDLYFETSDRKNLITELLENGTMTNWEQRIKKKDGSELWAVMNIRLVRDTGTGPQVIEGTLIDITEQYHAKELIRKSEELHRLLAENISDTIWIMDLNDMRVTYVSPSVMRMRGYTPEESAALTLSETLTPESYERMVTTLSNELSKDGDVDPERHVTLELEMYCKDGSTIWTEVHCRAIRDEAGNAARILGVTRDISTRKKWEETLRVERERFRALVDESPLGVSLIDPIDDRYEYVNQRFVQLFGYTLADLKTGRDWFDKAFPDEDYRKKVVKSWTDDLAQFPIGRSRDRTFDVTCKNGDVKTIHFRSVALQNGGQLVTYEDITERRMMEDKLTGTRNYLQNMIDSMPSLLMTVNHEGVVTGWNAEASKRTGLGLEQVKGKPLYEAVPALKNWKDRIQECVLRDSGFTVEKTEIAFRGEKNYFDLVVYPIKNPIKQSAVIRLNDITERVELEQMVLQSEKMASVGRLAAGLAHEINNPLAGVLQGSQMIGRRLDFKSPRNAKRIAENEITDDEILKLERYLLESRIFSFLRGIETSGRRAARIVSSMMEFSRSENIHIEMNPIHEIIDRSLSLAYTFYDLKPVGQLEKIQIDKQFDPRLERIPCDRQMLQQSLLNLIKNAFESLARHQSRADSDNPSSFSPEVCIETRRVDNQAEIIVEDNGPGIPEENQSRLFEPFFTTKSIDTHTGLGLFSTFGFIRRHRGTIEHRQDGEQTRFVIRLPLDVENIS